jgi:oligoendopeptidase F
MGDQGRYRGPVTTWDELQPRVDALLTAPITAADVSAWLHARDDLERDVNETFASLMRAKDEDTADTAAREAFLAFVRDVMPHVQVARHALDVKVHGVVGFEPPGDLREAWLDLEDRIAVFHPDNVPLKTREAELQQRYGEVCGGARAVLDGETVTTTAARARLVERDRGVRERAWRALDTAMASVQGELDEIFLELVSLRQRMARNAGFADYRAMSWRARHRREYTTEDALALHESVSSEVVPHLRRLAAERRARLGVDTLRPWDMHVDPDGDQPLRPFGSVAEFEAGLQRLFDALDPELGALFGRMRGPWLDLEPRPHKVPGLGYQMFFDRSRAAYVYMSAIGTDDDLVTMRHEAGHAFHAFAADERWPLLAQRATRPETCEFASEAMELLTLPYLERSRGGFYDAAEARRSQRAQIERVLLLLARTCAVDALQHWIYTQDPGTLTATAIEDRWVAINDRLGPDVDWRGLEGERRKWWQIVHVYQFPFYMLEYGMAFLGATQVWRHARHDHAAALAGYKRALALGGTAPIDRVYAEAGARFAFDRATVRELAEFLMAARDEVTASPPTPA